METLPAPSEKLVQFAFGVLGAFIGAYLSMSALSSIAKDASGFQTFQFSFDVFMEFGAAWLLVGLVMGFLLGFASLRKKLGILRLVFAWGIISLALGWYAHIQLKNPQFYINEIREVANGFGFDGFHEEEGTIEKCNVRLAAMGSKAIGPILDNIVADEWDNPGNDLDEALSKLGPIAHQRLLQKIATEQADWKRVICIVAIQDAFGDFSCLPTYLDIACRSPEKTSDFRLNISLRKYFGQAVPDVIDDNKRISPAFVRWYKTKSATGGPLPPWKP